MTLKILNKFIGAVSILLSILVVAPLTIRTIIEGGGPWGFEIVSLAILMPLNFYILFGLAALINNEESQRKYFIAGHLLTIATGVIGYFTFPVYPIWIAIVPLLLAVVGMVNHRNFKHFLLIMMVLSIVANALLLKWEIDFGRTVPFLQLFQTSSAGSESN